jgi:16S rRNA (cytosine967-C5)-methyltransferase
MTPAARIAAVIEIREGVDGTTRPGDEVVTAYFRSRRYIGSKDRRAIAERVFAIERRRARLDWWTGGDDKRARVIADLALSDGLTTDGIAALFSGEHYSPAPLTPEEEVLVQRLAGNAIETDEMPLGVRLETPDWLAEKLQAAWGENTALEMAALNQPAPLDLRVNTLKGKRDDAIARLAEDDITAQPTPLSPIGLRVESRANVMASRAYKDGLVEIQDEASQIAALLTGTKADRLTVDLCAGAGGKTLALAAMMKDGGPLIACDNEPRRFSRMNPRLQRAGVTNVTRKLIKNLDDPFLESLLERGERVLVDAPCSGAGAWRRNPNARWKLTPERLDQLIAEQRRILAAAAKIVKPGGRLIYVTCSVLTEENKAQADLFLDSEPQFRALAIADVWKATVGGTAPQPESGTGTYLSLTPARNGTDGFFVAVFEKAAA